MNRCVDGSASRCNRRSARSRPVKGCVAGVPAWPADVQDAHLEIDLLPAQIHELGRPEPVAEGQEDHRGVAMARGRMDQSLDLGLGQVLARPVLDVLFTAAACELSEYCAAETLAALAQRSWPGQ